MKTVFSIRRASDTICAALWISMVRSEYGLRGEVAEEALERGQEIADELRDRVAPLAAAMKRR